MLHHVGMPPQDADYIHGSGKVVNEILLQARPRNTLFTGSGRIAEKLANDLHGKVRIELTSIASTYTNILCGVFSEH